MRAIHPAMIFGFLAACAPAIPDSGAGVGFDNSEAAQNAREAALNTGQPIVPPAVLSNESGSFTTAASSTQVSAASPVSPRPLPTSAGATDGSDIAAQTAAALAVAGGGSGQTALQASATGQTPLSNAGISDENDFAAVSERQTIASDADRIARNAAQYEVVSPTALPTRSGSSQPNIVDFALSTSNPRGSRLYSRSGFNSAAKTARNCARFASPNQAQIEFLSLGGPQKDRKGLDPDGDGFACTWDPAPFRQAASN